MLPDPQTTKTKSAKSHGPTGYFSSCGRYKMIRKQEITLHLLQQINTELYNSYVYCCQLIQLAKNSHTL